VASLKPHDRAHVYLSTSYAEENPELSAAIDESLAAYALRTIRAEDISPDGAYIENVYNAIEQAGLVIGLSSSALPDTHREDYELAYAQHLRKETVLLTDDPASRPRSLWDVDVVDYSPTDLAALREKLQRWIETSRFLSSGEQGTILRRGEVFDTVVDGTFYLQRKRPRPSKEEIQDYLVPGAPPMPQRLLYLTEDGLTTYLDLCQDKEYTYYWETVNYVEAQAASLVDCVLSHCKSSEVDFISLGPGDGSKDSLFLGELLRRAEDLRYTYYYPYDVSGGLLLEAMRKILDTDIPMEKLRIKAIEGDVRYLSDFKKVFDYRREPNVFSLLGGLDNTSNEHRLLTTLHQVMNPEDCLLLEVRKKVEAATEPRGLGRLDLNKRLDLAPLQYVGAKTDPAGVAYNPVPSTSSVDNTLTVAAVADKVELASETYEKVSLFSVHYYDPAALKELLADRGFRILWREEKQENSLFYVCAKA
jgi:hypothetical protein